MNDNLDLTPGALLIHRDFIRSLARGILCDENRVDDVVQETMIAAMDADPEKHNRSWLSAVTRNLARQQLRRDSNRQKRERANARIDIVPSAADVAEREATRRTVVDAVLELPTTYRDVVLLRYYEDRTSREIARDLGIPAATVRTRIKRGLEKLREKLDAQHGGDRAAWSAALLPFATMRATAPAAATVAGAGVALGWAKIAAVGLFLAAATSPLWFPWKGENAVRPEAVETADQETSVPLPDAPPHSIVTAIDEGEDEKSSLPAKATAPALRGRLMNAAGGGVSDAGVFAIRWLPDRLPLRLPLQLADEAIRRTVSARTERTDAAGAFAFSSAGDGVHVIGTVGDRENGFSVQAIVVKGDGLTKHFDAIRRAIAAEAALAHAAVERFDGEGTLTLRAVRGHVVDGVVETPDRAPIAGARIVAVPAVLAKLAHGGYDAIIETLAPALVTTTGAKDGRFTLPGMAGRTAVLARADGFLAGCTEISVGTAADDAPEPTFIKLSPNPAIRVRFRATDEFGRAVENARSFFLRRDEVDDALAGKITVPDDRATFESDGRGHIAMNAPLPTRSPWTIETSETAFVCTTAAGYAPAVAEVDVVSKDGSMPLLRAAKLSGRVSNAETGKPVADALVSYRTSHSHGEVRSDAQGNFAFDRVPGTTIRLIAMADRMKTVTRDVDARRSPRLELALAPEARIVGGRIIDATGHDAPWFIRTKDGTRHSYLSLFAFGADPTPLLKTLRAGDPILYDLGRSLGPIVGTATFRVEARDEWTGDRMWLVLMAPGQAPIVRAAVLGSTSLTIPVSVEKAKAGLGRVRLTITDERGARIARPAIEVRDADTQTALITGAYASNGVADIALPSGRPLDLVLRAKGFATTILPGVVVKPGAEPKVLQARMTGEATLDLMLSSPDPIERKYVLACRVYDAANRLISHPFPRGRDLSLRGLGDGTYRVCLSARYSQAMFTVEMKAGQTLQRKVRLEPAVQVALAPSDACRATTGVYAATILDHRMRVRTSGRVGVCAGETSDLLAVCCLEPGQYTAIFRGPGAERSERVFTVPLQDGERKIHIEYDGPAK